MPIRWLDDVNDGEERDVGKKATSLATLSEHGIDTPRGFVVTAQTFEDAVRSNGLENQIESILNNVDRSDINSVQRAANRIKDLITGTDLADAVRHDIEEAYEKINMSEEVRNAGGEAVDLVGGQRETEFVAVRSSPTGSRIPGAHYTELNVHGKDAVIRTVKRVWASLYAAEALQVEDAVGSIHSMAVVVQRMVDADVSGTVFGRNPLSPTDSGYVIESLWGLGTALADGSATPDRFVVGSTGNLVEQDLVNKEWKIVRDPSSGKTVKQRVRHDERETRSLQPDDVSQLTDAVQKLENRLGRDIRLDFALSRNRFYALDVAQVPDQQVHTSGDYEKEPDDRVEPLITGRGAAAGTGRGTARVLYSDTDIDQLMQDDVLVSVNASPRIISALNAVQAVVTDNGGISSNMALLARTLDVPCIVGTVNATDMLTQGEEITVDAAANAVFEEEREQTRSGQLHEPIAPPSEPEPVSATTLSADQAPSMLTATRVTVLGPGHVETADGAIVPDFTPQHGFREIAAKYSPERVWVRTDEAGGGHENVGILTDPRADIREKGTILRTYGGVMRSNNLVERGARFIGLDVDALETDGDRESLLNSIQKIGTETTQQCESAVLLRAPDPDIVSAAVENGIDAVAVPAEHVPAARKAVAKAEKRFMLQKLREL